MTPVQKSLIRLVSAYSRIAPFIPGKGTLQKAALGLWGACQVEASAPGVGRFALRFPEDRGYEPVVFTGEFETGTTETLRQLLAPDDVAIDIGANLGWYSVLLGGLLAQGGCHAFEPSPNMLERLRTNCELNDLGNRVVLNATAVGEAEGQTQLYSFTGLGHGFSSLSTLGRRDYAVVQVPIVTLDRYIQDQGLSRIDLIKVDVEGAEMGVLRGASQLLQRPRPPIWLLEMNTETARAFGYAPHALLDFIASKGDYSFFRVVAGWGACRPMGSTRDYRHGDNVFCCPKVRQRQPRVR